MALLVVAGTGKMENDRWIVKNISFTQQPFQKIAIAGETGSGKTTLLKLIAGLSQPSSGEILFKGRKVKGPEEKLIPGHPAIAFMSQYFELRNNYWVHEILEYANKLSDEEAQSIYAVCQVDHLLKRRTDQLSGGEKQRIALARLLIGSPELLILDEPYSNLDAIHKSTIKKVIEDIGEQLGITCLLVSHDAEDVLSWADTILLMKEGEIIQHGTPEQVYYEPVNEYAAALLGEYNLLSWETAGLFLQSDLGRHGENLFIRPGDLNISLTNTNDVKGVVQKILFTGAAYLVDVTVENQTLRIAVTKSQFKRGDMVYLSLARASNWYL
jgi:ABC-type sugar transport system ATPase subunit